MVFLYIKKQIQNKNFNMNLTNILITIIYFLDLIFRKKHWSNFFRSFVCLQLKNSIKKGLLALAWK